MPAAAAVDRGRAHRRREPSALRMLSHAVVWAAVLSRMIGLSRRAKSNRDSQSWPSAGPHSPEYLDSPEYPGPDSLECPHSPACLRSPECLRSPGKGERRRPGRRGRERIGGSRCGVAGGCERGSITAETAVAFPALVIVLAVGLWGVSAAAAQVACVDAARAGARAAARGEPETEVRAAVLRAAPPDARVSVSRDPTTTSVVVQAEACPPLKDLFPTLKLRAQAVAATEPEGGTPMP